tara:strand:+ start:4875 stop:6380 length:1506 start_codon:yes stop_codon:yes gene_type:complete
MSLNNEDIINIINLEYKKYQDNSTIIQKINEYIYDLPNYIKNIDKELNQKKERKNLLLEGQDQFVTNIIDQKIYFYSQSSELFFKYDKINYELLKQDDLIYNILGQLNYKSNVHQNKFYEEQLLPWKFKIKNTVIKKIKEENIKNSIPESKTIQNIINIFTGTFFSSKNESKYFLSILGDIFLKKNIHNVYIISNKAKIFIRTIDNLITKYFTNNSLLNHFKFKFHDHQLNLCRLIKYINNEDNEIFHNNYYDLLKRNMINIYVISCYYSNRYENSDNLLSDINDNTVSKILYLKHNNIDNIIDNFIKEKIQICDSQNISFKNILYIWKSYINNIDIPNIIFQNNLKLLLKEKLNYNEELDVFINYTSSDIPFVSNFLKFWQENMYENNEEIFIEISEIIHLFKIWNSTKNTINFYDKNIIELIKHFFNDIQIEDDKYIFGYSCKLFNKKESIDNFISKNRDNINYEKYIDYTNSNEKNDKIKSNMPVSKSYFELYIQDKI